MANQMNEKAGDSAGPTYRKAVSERGRQQDTSRDNVIIAATLALLGECGYDALTMSGVAARAGVSKATLYRRWGAKPELVADAVSTIGFGLPPSYPGTSLRDDLLALLIQASACSDRPQLLKVAIEAARSSPALKEVLRARFLAYLRREIGEIAKQALKEGAEPFTASELTALTDTTAAFLIYVSNSDNRAGEHVLLENFVEHVLLVLVVRKKTGTICS